MKQQMRLRLLGLVMALGLLLSACGEPADVTTTPDSGAAPQTPQETAAVVPQTTASPQEQTGFAYEAQWQELSLPDAYPERLFFVGDSLMLEASTDSGRRTVYLPETGAEVAAEGLPGNVLAIAPGADCLWYCVETGDGLSVCSVPAEGGSVRETISLGGSGGFFPYTMAVDGDGVFYLMNADTVCVYSAAGKKVSDFALGSERGMGLTRLSGGQVVLSTQTLQDDGTYYGSVALLNSESIGSSITEKSSTYRVYAGWDGLALLNDGGGLYTLDTEANTIEAVLDWIDTDVNPEELVSVAARDRETVYLISSTQTGIRLGTVKQVPAGEQRETVINLGFYVWHPEEVSAISALAVNFNQSQSDFRVHLVNYNNYSDGQERLLADAGDLDLVLTSQTGLEGMELADLTAFFDDQVGESTLLPWVYRGLTAQGAVTAMPQYFTVSTLVGKKSLLGETEGWTPKELAETAAAHPEAALLQYCNAYDALQTLLEPAGTYVTDFASVLEAAGTLPVAEDAIYELPANLQSSALPGVADGTLLLEPMEISGFDTLLGLYAALGEELVLKGYPADSGNGCILRGSPLDCLAIPAASRHQQEAWSFLKAILTDETMVQLQRSMGFPVLEAAFEQTAQEAMEGLRYADESGNAVVTGGQVTLDGKTYEVEPLTQAQLEKFRAYLEGACGFGDDSGMGLVQQARDALKRVLEEGVSPEDAAKDIHPE